MKLFVRILLILLCVILALVLLFALFAADNKKTMNNTLMSVKECLSDCGKLTEKNHNYKTVKLFGIIKFNVNQYELENVGNVSIMTVNMGVMQMGTLVVAPYDKDVPVLSTDFMYMLANRKYIMEMDNTVIDSGEAYQAKCKEGNQLIATFSDLAEYPGKPSWLDEVQDVLARKQSKDTSRLDTLVTEVSRFYVDWLKEAPQLTAEERAEKVGSMIGDNVEVGCGCVLNPGTVIGRNTNIYPLTSVRGAISADSIVKSTSHMVAKKTED